MRRCSGLFGGDTGQIDRFCTSRSSQLGLSRGSRQPPRISATVPLAGRADDEGAIASHPSASATNSSPADGPSEPARQSHLPLDECVLTMRQRTLVDANFSFAVSKGVGTNRRCDCSGNRTSNRTAYEMSSAHDIAEGGRTVQLLGYRRPWAVIRHVVPRSWKPRSLLITPLFSLGFRTAPAMWHGIPRMVSDSLGRTHRFTQLDGVALDVHWIEGHEMVGACQRIMMEAARLGLHSLEQRRTVRSVREFPLASSRLPISPALRPCRDSAEPGARTAGRANNLASFPWKVSLSPSRRSATPCIEPLRRPVRGPSYGASSRPG